MDAIDKANPGVFDDEGRIIAKDWTRITIPENNVDVFQLYTHALLTMLGVTVQWVDSWSIPRPRRRHSLRHQRAEDALGSAVLYQYDDVL